MKTVDDMTQLEGLAEQLLPWYEEVRRSLPWREDPSPYHVWISEIMLQQTRIEAVIHYYHRFLEAFPTIRSLAEAEEEYVLKLWEGLGYYSRARNLKKAAMVCMDKYDGKMPADYQELLSLPGIGSYTAGAVASIAFHIPVAAVDGNVLRVISRYRMDDSDILKDAVKKKYHKLLTAVMPEKHAAAFNQALMELGERICIPNGRPLCQECPLKESCLAHRNGTEEDYPVRSPKKKRRIEPMTILLLNCEDRYAIRKRPSEGLLAGLYEFPWLEGYKDREWMEEWLKKQGIPGEIEPLRETSHIFSHIEWHMQGWRIRTAKPLEGDWTYYTVEEIRREFPIPTAMKKYDIYLV